MVVCYVFSAVDAVGGFVFEHAVNEGLYVVHGETVSFQHFVVGHQQVGDLGHSVEGGVSSFGFR